MGSQASGLSVIIPFYNEAGNVIPLIEEIIQTLPALTFEIVAIDDGSTDKTFEELKRIANAHTCVRVLRHNRNYGQSMALLTGARQASHQTLVTMDGDGQNDPKDIITLFDYYTSLPLDVQDKTVVFGTRHQRQDNLLRRFSSIVANGFRTFILKDSCPDTGCALKLFPRHGFLTLPLFNHFHRFLPALFKALHYQILHVSVSHRPRLRGQSKYGVWNRLWVGLYDIFGVKWLLNRICCPQLEEDDLNQDQAPSRLSA